MRFRTEIEKIRTGLRIDHSTPVLMLGSCFTDEIGSRLAIDGFEVMHNPMGPLYNPASVLTLIERSLGKPYDKDELTPGPRGFHCLDYASRYCSDSADKLVTTLALDLDSIHCFIERKPLVFITLGSSFVFEYKSTSHIVGNCHKLPSNEFNRFLLTSEQISCYLQAITDRLVDAGCRGVVFTVSPIRHLADGLHGNNISKSMLQVGLNALLSSAQKIPVEYFPSYEILLDDLRDYRFYAPDMKHPSDVAVDYIYSHFSDAYFDEQTKSLATENRRRFLSSQHRPIL